MASVAFLHTGLLPEELEAGPVKHLQAALQRFFTNSRLGGRQLTPKDHRKPEAAAQLIALSADHTAPDSDTALLQVREQCLKQTIRRTATKHLLCSGQSDKRTHMWISVSLGIACRYEGFLLADRFCCESRRSLKS